MHLFDHFKHLSINCRAVEPNLVFYTFVKQIISVNDNPLICLRIRYSGALNILHIGYCYFRGLVPHPLNALPIR